MQERYWQAIVANDASYDGTFYYAVTTTGIFCRPSCKSRVPKRENVRVFQDRQTAVAEHFRPCKRCRPDGLRLPDEEWIELIASYIKEKLCRANYALGAGRAVLCQRISFAKNVQTGEGRYASHLSSTTTNGSS